MCLCVQHYSYSYHNTTTGKNTTTSNISTPQSINLATIETPTPTTVAGTTTYYVLIPSIV